MGTSAIHGKGWGFDHNWHCLGTPYSGITHYKCDACGVTFSHLYHVEPSIGKAMHDSGVAEHCPAIVRAEGRT